MLTTIGIRPIIKSAIELSSIDEGLAPGNHAELLRQFHDYLGRQNDAVAEALSQPGGPLTPPDSDVSARLLREFDSDSSLDDVSYEVLGASATSNTEVSATRQKVQSAIDGAATYGAEFALSIQLHLPVVIVAPSGSLVGGTVSNVPGAIWFNPRAEWVEQDYVEFVLHELTHTHLFIEERRFGFYRDVNELMREENFVRSSLRRTPRPIDKALHSLFVALEVVELRRRVSSLASQSRIHPETDEIVAGVMDTAADLERSDLDRLLYPRAAELSRVGIAKAYEIQSQSQAVGT